LKKIAIIFLLLRLLLSSPLLAQDYKLNVGDSISISVWGHSDLNLQTSINPNGEISFPLVGNIIAEGKTANQLQQELKKSLAEYIIEPEVNINLVSYRKLKVIVMGEVQNEGSFEIRSDSKVLNLISMAGGITENADAQNANLQRENETLEINLKELLKGNNSNENYNLKNGDRIYIPEREIMTASIQGEIAKPGQYELDHEKEIRLNQLLAQSGSLTEEAGEILRLISDDEPQEYQVEATLAAEAGSNPVIKDGDSIYIPSVLEKVTILGEIASPGSYQWNEDMRLANLVARAGNTSDRANLEKIRLVSQEGKMREINMEDFFEDSDLAANPNLKPGDLVMIGEKDSIDWSNVFFLFSGFNGIKDFFDISW
jgi:polysaccharide export outer membrane protein